MNGRLKTREESDAALVELSRSGNLEAFRSLVEKYQDRIYNAIFRVVGHADDADNLLQETFFKAWSGLQGFKAESQFSTWVYRIAMNVCASHLRKYKTTKHQRLQSLDAVTAGVESREGVQIAAPAKAPGERMMEDEKQMVLQQAIAELEPDLRRILVLKDVEDRSYEDIADIIGCPVGTVKSRLFKAREWLRGKMLRYMQ